MTLENDRFRCFELHQQCGWYLERIPPGSASFMLAAGIDDAQVFSATWFDVSDNPPAGNPGSLRSSATSLADAATRLAGIQARWEGLATGELPDGMVGAAGAEATEVLLAFADLARLESTGLDILSSAIRTYADILETAQDTFASATSGLDLRRSTIMRLSIPWLGDMEPDEQDAELESLASELRSALLLAEYDFGRCLGAYDDVIDAQTQLRSATIDASGYARLAGVSTQPAGADEAMVLARARGVEDPDKAVLSDAEWEAYLEVRKGLDGADRAALDAALANADDPLIRQLLMSAVATGAPLSAVVELGEQLAGLSPARLHELATLRIGGLGVAGSEGDRTSLRIDGQLLAQLDGTTCGSSSLLLLAAQYDPFLAYWLATGETIDGHVPSFLEGLDLDEISADAIDDRLLAAQLAIRDRANGWTWPGSWWGTAPWGLNDEAEVASGLEHGTSGGSLHFSNPASDVDAIIEAVNTGSPVILLSGPEVGTVDVPRHYVVVVGHHDGVFQVYEPGSGAVHEVSEADLRDPSGNGVPALGNWPYIYGAVVPETH